MKKYTVTCNCYEPPMRANITVEAESLGMAWDKAKKKFARKYKAKLGNISITATHRYDAE